jgi:glutathione S-transferase
MSDLILYGEKYWFSPFVFSAYVALVEKGLTFEERTFDLFTARDHLDPAFQRASITGTVPTLVHGGFWLGESAAIVEYIDESFPNGQRLLPAEPKERARVRQVMGFLRTRVEAIRDDRPTSTMFYARTTKPFSPPGRQAAERLLRATEGFLEPGASTLASTWSIADAELAFMLHRLVANGDPVPPRIEAYAKAQWERPSVRRFVTHARPAEYTGS